jgi:hypothetical protein
LYFTPMIMVDGRIPMLGSDRASARAAIERSLREPSGVALGVKLDQAAGHKDLTVELAAKSSRVAGLGLLIGVAVTEDPISTEVRSGENAGRTLVEHHVVRTFAHKFARLARSESTTLRFPIKPGPAWVAERCRVGVFVQDRADGRVYQADAIAWETVGGNKNETSSTARTRDTRGFPRASDPLRVHRAGRTVKRDATVPVGDRAGLEPTGPSPGHVCAGPEYGRRPPGRRPPLAIDLGRDILGDFTG